MGGAHISDAFTIWAKADLHKDQYNTDVTEATKRLIRVRGLLRAHNRPGRILEC